MKVVLFCGGFGWRLRPTTSSVPKPLIPVGGTPIIVLLMKYYSYFGHRDFILCLGYKGDEIRECLSKYPNDIVNVAPSRYENKELPILGDNFRDWRITFANTGLETNIGQRLKAVKEYLDGEDWFLANYSDGLTDMYLPDMVNFALKRGKTGALIAVKPALSVHVLSTAINGDIKSLKPISRTPLRINGGYFVFKKEIFDFINDGEDLVNEPFERLIKNNELVAYPYDGFWASLDTFKDKQRLDEWTSKVKPSWDI